MSVTSERLSYYTDSLVEQYIKNGDIPDELVIARKLATKFADYYDPTTDIYTINQPTWTPRDLQYRETANLDKWNMTQQMAAEEMYILYRDIIADTKSLTDNLYNYTTRAKLIQTRLANLRDRINNLLLLSTDTSGFLYSFFDNFNDTSKVSYDIEALTTAHVDTVNNLVELPRSTDMIEGISWQDTIMNLAFLTINDIDFSILNAVEAMTPLSSTSMLDIFNNKATAWQQQITISDNGPLVAQLTVRVSPLDPVYINKIEINPKMSNYNTQLSMQVFYSVDGVSFQEVQSASNPQFISGPTVFNFTPTYVTHFRFVMTKQAADTGSTYDLGFQNINFIQTQYVSDSNGKTLYSIPVTFPDKNRPIGKVVCDACSNLPANTTIDYSVVVSGTAMIQEIPISLTSDSTPKYTKIIDLGSLGNFSAFAPSGVQWVPESGRLTLDVDTIASKADTAYADTIAQTMTIYRNIGSSIFSTPYNNIGYRVPPSGVGIDYFLTNVIINNDNGSTIDFKSVPAVLDGRLVNGATTIGYGAHQVATQRLDIHQGAIASGTDLYFSRNMKYVSPFDFYNNYKQTDITVFTYSDSKIMMNPISAHNQQLVVDCGKSFIPSNRNDGTYLSSTVALPDVTPGALVVLNAGGYTQLDLDQPQWINEVQFTLQAGSACNFRILASMDGITYSTVSSDTSEAGSGYAEFGAIILDQPFFAQYIQIYVVSGSDVDMTSSKFALFPPLFAKANSIYTTTIYLPEANVWNSITDQYSSQYPPSYSQSYILHNGFVDDSPASVDGTDISLFVNPKIYIEVQGTDPHVNGVTINSVPIPDEVSCIGFAYHSKATGIGPATAYNSIRFKAVLKTSIAGITPELTSYRVKIS